MIRTIHLRSATGAEAGAYYESAYLPKYATVLSMKPTLDGVVIEVEYPDDGDPVEVYDPPRKIELWKL